MSAEQCPYPPATDSETACGFDDREVRPRRRQLLQNGEQRIRPFVAELPEVRAKSFCFPCESSHQLPIRRRHFQWPERNN
jgi:hypothetical protein